MEPIPSQYFISKGTGKPIKNGTIELECYRYDIKKDEDGFGYYAVCDELHAVTQGDTWSELKANILDVHSLVLETINDT